MKEKSKCNATSCETLTASKVGFCAKHFYMCKRRGTQSVPVHPAISVTPGGDIIEVPISATQLDSFWTKLAIGEKAQIMIRWITGA